MDDINIEPIGPSNEDATTLVDDVEEIQQTPRVTHNLNRTPSALRKRGRNAKISSAVREMVANSRSRLELFSTSSSTTQNTMSLADPSLIECVKALEALPNVDRLKLVVSLTMVEEVVKDNKTTSTFNDIGQNNIKSEMKMKLGRSYQLKQLKNKVHKLRIEYRSFKKMLAITGFGWCAETGIVVTIEEIYDRQLKTMLISSMLSTMLIDLQKLKNIISD
ncbi:hypothetical protein NE237_014147 [Protea cynaroides]|uniref:Myb/SANT-like domain-containing protein n=1 Tax=Protea cynaroides TaxID=273540 RepID=A0A9Q0JYL1_9MAGN|nr:hypothetical protein NE237_014147 [Protea cynaroides]